MKKLSDLPIKRIALSLGQLLLGCLIYSISISVFYSPSKLLGGGVTGIAQLLNYSLGLPVSLMMILINVPLFILSFIFLDKYFTFTSMIGMLALTGCLQLTSGLHLEFSSPLTSIAVGGVLNGLGLGLIYRSDASVGGTDIISKIIQRYYSGNMAYTGLAINGVIISVSALIHGLDQAVLTICAMYISSKVDTYLIDGIDHRRGVMIVTTNPHAVAESILRDVKRGATLWNASGAYSHSDKTMVYVVIARRELARLKRAIKSTDPNAFFTIHRLTGVYGNGHGFHSVKTDIK